MIVSLNIILVFTVQLFSFCESLVHDLCLLFSRNGHPASCVLFDYFMQLFVTIYLKFFFPV